MKKRILITHIHMELGGIEVSLVHLLNSLDKNKYEIDLVLFKKSGEYLGFIPKWVNVISFYENSRYKNTIINIVKSKNILIKIIKYSLFNKFTVKRYVKKKQYDTAIAFSGYFTFMDLYAGFSNSKNKLIWVHSDFYWSYYNNKKFRNLFKMSKNKYKMFNKIIAVSQSAAKEFKKLLPGQSSKVDYLWNLNIKSNFSNKELNVKLNGIYKIVSVGRLVFQKGFDRLIEIQKILKENGYETIIYLVGDGPLKKELESKIKQYNLEKNFILLGKQMDIYSILNQADLFVMCSYSEGFGNVLIESLISGTPIVCPNVTGASDVCRYIAPKNSVILTENSIEGICDGIIRAMNGEVKKGFKFDLDKVNEKIKEKFERLIE